MDLKVKVKALEARAEDAEAKLAEAELAVEQQANAIQELADLLEALRAERPTLRDEFAMRALGHLLNAEAGSGPFYLSPLETGRLAYRLADAALEARKP